LIVRFKAVTGSSRKAHVSALLFFAFGFSSATIGAWKELIPMAIDIEHLKHFQSEQLEQKNIQTSARIPIHSRTIEWALIEIVILLTGISDSLKRMADRP
jgi:hypothetical protein